MCGVDADIHIQISVHMYTYMFSCAQLIILTDMPHWLGLQEPRQPAYPPPPPPPPAPVHDDAGPHKDEPPQSPESDKADDGAHPQLHGDVWSSQKVLKAVLPQDDAGPPQDDQARDRSSAHDETPAYATDDGATIAKCQKIWNLSQMTGPKSEHADGIAIWIADDAHGDDIDEDKYDSYNLIPGLYHKVMIVYGWYKIVPLFSLYLWCTSILLLQDGALHKYKTNIPTHPHTIIEGWRLQ